jgi:polysaccharide deacetylase 2 family uncharacterized protein YibQ
MAKRKKTKSDKYSKLLTYIAWFLGIIALLLSTLLAGYYFGYKNAQTDSTLKEDTKSVKKTNKVIKKDHKKKKILPKITKEEDVKKRLKEVLKKPPREYISASHELDNSEVIIPPKHIEKIIITGKPKLAIIIDDVCVKSQVKSIKNLHLPLTMSFLPPSKYRPNSAKLAAKEDFYMVHLPMEAMRFTAEEPTTLHVKDSQKKIKQRIEMIKKLFPKVKYINNHTGSKFTADEVSMNKLISVLKENNITFVDSRTTAKTKAPKVLKNFGLEYISRDVFLDHHMEKSYVKKQIREAIKIAKIHGSAIAIGHPHKNTLAALRESKKLFKDVELVYINKL